MAAAGFNFELAGSINLYAEWFAVKKETAHPHAPPLSPGEREDKYKSFVRVIRRQTGNTDDEHLSRIKTFVLRWARNRWREYTSYEPVEIERAVDEALAIAVASRENAVLAPALG
jgi:hypothetical protein